MKVLDASAIKGIKLRGTGCGRCGGTGAYYVGQHAAKGVCFKCRGAGKVYSPQAWKNYAAFNAWKAEAKRTWQETVEVITSGRFGRTWEFEHVAEVAV
jgi:hypothetical protein